MLERLRFKDLQGLSFRNLTVKLAQGIYDYTLASQSDLGLPENALCFGVMVRKYESNTNSKFGRPLLNPNALSSTVLTILDTDTKAILDEFPLASAANEDIFIYFEPRKRCEIDWSKSKIQILNEADRILVENATDFEIVVMYYDPFATCKIQSLLNLSSGLKMPGIRTSSFEVLIDPNEKEYSIATQSSLGIDNDDIILGFYPFQRNGVKQAIDNPSFESAYMVMSKQTRTFIDFLPLGFDQGPFWYFDTPYIPIQPTIAGDIDWETSRIVFTKDADLEPNTGFVWNLVYYRNK